MNIFEIWLLAISLAIDCFTVSVASGVILKQPQWRTFLTMGFLFGLFQAIMPLLGWYGASTFNHLIKAYDHWIAFGLLCLIGIRMIKEYFNNSETYSFNPTQVKVILTLAVATSIDALAVGISFAFTGFLEVQSLLMPLFIIGFSSFLLSVLGNLIGVFFGKQFNLRMELFGALVLIGIGLKILIEHLYFNH